MRILNRTILIVLLGIGGITVFSQKKPQLTPQQRRANALQYALDAMENSLKTGDYAKAYDISTRLNSSLDSYEKKQATGEVKKKAEKLLILRHEAYAAIMAKDYKLALEKYDSILRQNPTDNITKSDKANLIAIINQPKDNVLDRVIASANTLFDEATRLNIKNNIDEIEDKLSKARKIWVIVGKTSPNYQRDLIAKNIAAANDILGNINGIRIAIKNGNTKKAIQLGKGLDIKYPAFHGLPDEIIKEAKENQKKYFAWKNEAEEAFCKLDYALVLKRINSIRQLAGYENDPYVSPRGRRFNISTIQKAKADIEKTKNDVGQTGLTITYYEKILEHNPCDKNEYYAFVKGQFTKNISYIDGNTCPNILKYGTILLRVDEQKAVDEGIKSKIDECDNQVACLDKCRNIYLVAYNTAMQLKNQGRLSEAENRLKSDIIDNESSIINCKCDSIFEKANSLLVDIAKEKKWAACIDNAKISLYDAIDNQGKGQYDVALKALNAIDTTCLVGSPDLLTKIRTTRKKVEFEQKERLYIALRDSALIQESKEYYKDLFDLLSKAKAIAPDSARLAEIDKLISTKCCQYKDLESREKDIACSFCGGDCCPPPIDPPKESSPIKKIELSVGGNSTSGYILLNNAQNKGKYSFEQGFGWNAGVRFQRTNFRSMVDYRAGINFSHNTISFNPSGLAQSSGLIQGKFDVLGLDIPLDLKWHRRKSYHTDIRYYLITGLQSGKNFVSKIRSQSNYQDDMKVPLNTFYAGYKVGLGVEYNEKKQGLSLELDYRMKGNIYENDKFSNPFKANANFRTINLSLWFRAW